jgi:hypothetical protein
MQPAVSINNLGSINNYSDLSEPEPDSETESSSESESNESDFEIAHENAGYISPQTLYSEFTENDFVYDVAAGMFGFENLESYNF